MSDHVHPARRRSRRRLLSALPLALAAALTAAGSLIPALPGPFGATADAEPVPVGTPGVTHYFGRGAYDGIRAAVAATPRACALSDDELAAMVMAPVFKEVSMAETPETAPSPMTLSRWDEWTGIAAGNTNMNANYGLYPFADPYGTPYPRAYWTPGIGMFQYDSAGVGAPFTAAQLIDVRVVAGDVAAGMAGRYCASGGTGPGARAAAWQPWGALGGIGRSEALYQEMMAPDVPPFARIGLVDGIEDGGGMQARTCMLGGQPTACWLVDPARAQGANWWAQDDPTGGAVASGEAPLPAPFYVVVRNGREERHWLSVDSGYPVNLSASRVLGANARPRAGQPDSGLLWYQASDLCDTARPELGCAPPAPAPAPVPAPADPAAADPPAVEAPKPVSELLKSLRLGQGFPTPPAG